MDTKRAFLRAGYAVLFALLGLVFYSVYETTQREPTERFRLFSGASVPIVSLLCLATGIIAGAAAIFFVTRAFYLAFTRPDVREKYERKG